MGQQVWSNAVAAGEKVQIEADKTATYEVVCPDGTRVEFLVHAGQSFTLTAGSSTGEMTIHVTATAGPLAPKLASG